MKQYIVYSPTFETYSFNGIDPPEYGACAVEIEADNVRDAKRFALRMPEMKDWILEARDNDQNPFSGLKAEHLQCPHGVCGCCVGSTECKICDEEFEKEYALQVP